MDLDKMRAMARDGGPPALWRPMLLDAADEIKRLREAIAMADNRLETAAYKIGDEVETCEHCIALARSYLSPYLP